MTTVTVFYRYKALSGYWLTSSTIFSYKEDFESEFFVYMKAKNYVEWEITNIS